MSETRYNPVLHRTAQLTAAATLLLIFMGGLVTSHGAGMSVPDWPNSYGYNMFTFPVSKWVGGIFYEHTHRLMGTVVGFLTILLLLVAWGWGEKPSTRKWLWITSASLTALAVIMRIIAAFISDKTHAGQTARLILLPSASGFLGLALIGACTTFMRNPDPRRWVRWLAVSVLGAVIFQGVLGGLRVVLVELDLAIVHACVAQAFFCLTALVAVVTSRWWIETSPQHSNSSRTLVRLLAVCSLAIYLQLIVGAAMRHFEAGLAIPDLPLSYGHVLPPMDQASLNAVNQQRIPMQLPPVTLGQVWLHFGHRIGACLVTILLIWSIARVLSKEQNRALRRPAVYLVVLLATQLTLGILTVLMRKPADIASLHVAVGALTLMTTFVLLVRSMRLHSPIWQPKNRGFEISDLKSNASLVPA